MTPAAAVVGLHLSGRENAPQAWVAAMIRELTESGKFVVVENPEEAQVQLHVGMTGPIPKGAWYFQFGRGGDYFDEASSGEPAADVSLMSWEGRVLAKARIAVWQGVDWRKTLRDAQSYAPRLLRQPIGDILECPGDHPPQTPGTSRPPTLLARSMFLARKLPTSLAKRIRARNRDIGWYIALRSGAHPAFQTFPANTLCAADPWLIQNATRLYMFYEEMDDAHSNGRLACVEILGGSDGQTIQYGERRVILEAPHHLSYPAVFPDGAGNWFLIPESSANRTVDLYIADEFPWRWRKVRTLQQGVKLVDTTPIPRAEGGWWFFTGSMIGEAAAEAYLYSSKTIDGDWKPHPANPICADIQRARMAGPIWRDPTSAKLYRPAQDCSIRYGYAITWNEILTLNDDVYKEREAGRIEPSWTPDGLGTHTICRLDNGWEARDGIVRVPTAAKTM